MSPIKREPQLCDTESLKDGIYRVAVKGCLKFRKELARDRLNVPNARHRQQNAFCAAIKGELETLGQILNRNYASTKTHVP